MNGEQLYLRYQVAMGKRDVSVDDWDELEEEDQAAWNEVAASVVDAREE